jgi:hypothetical protein
MHGSDRCATHVRAAAGAGAVARGAPLTPELVDRIAGAVAAGSYLAVAVAAAGVARATFQAWWARGDPARELEAGDEPYRQMRERVERSRAEGETRNIAMVANAARENWQAAAWILERSAPERWARASQRELVVPELPAPSLDDPFAELDELAQRRARATRDAGPR